MSSLIINLSGCTAGFVKPPAGSPSMAEVYSAANRNQLAFNGMSNDAGSVVKLPKAAFAPRGKKGDLRVINTQFPKLPNPQSLMYIFGHYAGDGEVPVPGHFTAFSLYSRNYYGLPNEIQSPYSDGRFN